MESVWTQVVCSRGCMQTFVCLPVCLHYHAGSVNYDHMPSYIHWWQGVSWHSWSHREWDVLSLECVVSPYYELNVLTVDYTVNCVVQCSAAAMPRNGLSWTVMMCRCTLRWLWKFFLPHCEHNQIWRFGPLPGSTQHLRLWEQVLACSEQMLPDEWL